MEKRANNLTKGITNFILSTLIIPLFLFSAHGIAQETDFEEGKQYILGGLTVTGLQSYNEQTVKSYTGLRVGQPIKVPGDEISAVIKKLWSLDLFSNVEMFYTKIEDDKIFLELSITERPTLNNVTVYGVKKRKVEDIIDDTDLKKGKKITESLIANTKNYLQNKYKKQGFLNAKVSIATTADTTGTNVQNMVINVNKGDKVKIKDINFVGNEKLSNKKLRKSLKNTKKKKFYRFWKKSKYIEADYEEDLDNLIDTYAERGYRDARVLSDTFVKLDEKNIELTIKVEEGDKYYFGDIDFVGNSVYTDRMLSQVLGIKKGDTYNGVLLKERVADDSDPDAQDLTNLYQNNGYLFSSINPVEVSAVNDTIDFEIRIIEGKETFLDHVTVSGNDKTNDHVIYREIRTRPGQKYSKSNIVRTIRELGQLGFFDAEQIVPDIINPDPNAGTVDVNYSLVESGSSQIELQGGFGGGGFIGTLGLSFSNFSLKNIFNKEAYKPVPMGDGQTFALRLQASRTFRVYSLNFSEPWLGGKKPVRFNLSVSRTQQFRTQYNQNGRFDVDKSRGFAITGVSAGLAKRVQWPDDFFTISHSLSYQLYDFNDYNSGLFNFGNGSSNSLSYTFGISRSSQGPSRIFPTSGSNFELTAKFTPPYSLFSGKDYKQLKEDIDDTTRRLYEIGEPGSTEEQLEFNQLSGDLERMEEERFKLLEYYKIKFKGDWYQAIVGKLTLRTNAEFGFLGAYNHDIGNVPFERFYVGGDGLGNFTLDGRDVVQLRGYENQSLTPYINNAITGNLEQDGGTIYNKFSLELRYPLTLKPSASIYALSFLEAGNAFNNFNEYNPFELKRSAGVGLRIFMPAFGLLGIDFGYGFDTDARPGSVGPSGWQTHFIIGQQF
ncbi:outer membrane protein assembly factor BamA [Flagellimonas halotolerans]|uniref:Outer membrane protein assembly factor BamA n=1 Tax=Flagellimonas halotolerans TaxID=3112164 RepID=A0ABU6IUK8_9FLAO|nr:MULTISPECIES: outer membrane protein assembly factor BamA [unclassified Allomuricauda]MEC3966817.1 outer membrane protein assembly factor BamA [Muricauda sp. SYSU M86414]MEC4266667.1 outer membrane protein assembly factor BamA [Muricauda sp. SYSU M84420]